MQQAISSPVIESGASGKERLTEAVTVAAVLTVTAAVYALLFNRSNVLSHSVGYNLYASERVLEGAVPYRDFHTLYPPATFWLNAALFKWLGVSLHSALVGVLIFKVLTVGVIYSGGRQIMPRAWALAAALSSLLWLRPNGPFKSVPMQYGLLVLTLAMLFLLKHENRRKPVYVFLCGASLGLVALFKHNIGAYALAGSLVLLFLEWRGDARQTSVCRADSRSILQRLIDKLKFVGPLNYRRAFILLLGFASVLLPAMVYMLLNGAQGAMIRTLLFGPGEFLLSRLAIPLSPVAPVALVMAVVLIAYAAHKSGGGSARSVGLWLSLIAAITLFAIRGREADINQIILYMPMIVLCGGALICVLTRTVSVAERRASLMLFVFSAAALMELFPRFAREQSIAAMPLMMLFLIYLLYLFRPALRFIAGGSLEYRLALAVLPLTLVLIEGRLFINTYFDGLRFKAAAEVDIERGRGVYFPAATAAMIDNAVGYIQQRVPASGDAFAQSDAGTSLLFLSNRRNASNAQFWIGVGVTQQERS
ncbi:MAG TPA: glycosyltransferase family 39 protein, partial [Blastocatellia bacterium]|nr:glycosyltransferase family 39 protein [Blastocatellia bacterium]